MPPKKKGPTPVEALRHKESRVNIPTQELREFVREEEESPSRMLYPRDPSLDPQLVWRGKDEQDQRETCCGNVMHGFSPIGLRYDGQTSRPARKPGAGVMPGR